MGRITGTRGDVVIREPDVVGEGNDDVPNSILANQLNNLAAKTVDKSRPVDEYQSKVPGGSTLEILPEYELDEIIDSIVLIGTPTDTVAMQIGNFFATITLPTSGVVSLQGLGWRIQRNDRRLFTPTSDTLAVRMSGHADMQGFGGV
ncbi:MAG: hypothetical protein WAL41_10725 [Mycobacterium sp.]